MSESLYSKLSKERKELQQKGLIPSHMTTGGWQLFKDKYLYGTTEAVKGQFERIASTASQHLPKRMQKEAYDWFFKLLWNGWLSPSTPILANMGTDRGLPVACSGGNIEDSIDGFYKARHETAILTKHGFGTSAYLGNIRPRGSSISVGGKASGVLPVFKGFVQDMRDVAQGTARRGAWAGYLPITHGDFDEICDFLFTEPDDVNVGWVIDDSYISALRDGDEEALRRYQKSLKTKMITGKGYYWFADKVNSHRPQDYVENNLKVSSSNLCVEIDLFADEDHTFTCVLSSMNLAKYREWKDTDAVHWAIVFLDCVAEEFLTKARHIPGLEKAVRFTEKGRALGLGVCGFHTYLQQEKIAYDSFSALVTNYEIFFRIQKQSNKASKWLGEKLGVPLWCKRSKMRNTHLLAIAPTKSTALIMGGVSEGINPDPAMAFTQTTAGGEVERINPVLYELMLERKSYTPRIIKDIIDHFGSVQHVEWLSPEEKQVFKTAFEINQEQVIRLASQRQKFLCQGQSVNLFFAAEEDPAWISHIHRLAFEDPDILGLYYVTTLAGVHASKDCEACQ